MTNLSCIDAPAYTARHPHARSSSAKTSGHVASFATTTTLRRGFTAHRNRGFTDPPRPVIDIITMTTTIVVNVGTITEELRP